ncbi:DUF2085 domain-containing protein [Clostridium estertheticum]|uniref:DUF2085 domain-containing protein n=1 Tax=Clostridium estertheticum TaxID=238834 RepID=UPI001C6E2509|nr:DUF2085 domain-containing protein [Clostridium estertheticum]MBW9173350.1 DUF2085 domain-containing protein [Clostridium estertheticum]MBX4261261.1 DUF2085 domain-containing protein [Clostridium estertheticum]WLC71699.1 DUF2085 domain-containing protein [Clostridium estertheticum]WLC73402.1 DUF2085 domain-containing protein [Clostridium estertheticum]
MFSKLDVNTLWQSWGKKPYCNKKSERAPHINDFCFPICWRCFSLSLGLIITYLTLGIIEYMTTIQYSIVFLIISLIGCTPTIIDGALQNYCGIKSTNFRRCITGLVSGVSLAFVVRVLLDFNN